MRDTSICICENEKKAQLEITNWKFQKFNPHEFMWMILKVNYLSFIISAVFKSQHLVFSSGYISQLGVQFLIQF